MNTSEAEEVKNQILKILDTFKQTTNDDCNSEAGKQINYFNTNPSKNFVLKSPLRKRSSCIN